MPGYVYRGAILDAHPKVPECGSRRGYQAHLYRGETACPPCKAANTAYTKERKRGGNRVYVGFREENCGTFKGYGSHKYHGVPLCGPCDEAGRKYFREYRAKKRAA